MKIKPTIKTTCLMAVVLAALGAATTALAAALTAPAIQGQITLRPLTPSEINDYSLTGTQGASGLSTVGVGQPAYLEALVNASKTTILITNGVGTNAIITTNIFLYGLPDTDITNVTWTLTARPIGSAAALVASPLGTNVPTYKMADRYNQAGATVYKVPQVGGLPVRKLLRPDVTGQYTVTVTLQTTNSGSTTLTQNITAGTYVGVFTCELCHSGGFAESIYPSWSQTPHATFFTRAIDGLENSHYSKNCISCHTVGYDANTNAVNGGFDDVAAQLGWTFPTVLTNGNWASIQANYPTLANLANIQCENCHGPGSEHAAAFGNTNLVNWPRIAKTYDAGDCAQCHDSKNNHIKSAEWNNSLHARVTRTPSGAGRAACARCHTAGGFAGYADTLGTTNTYTTNNADTVYNPITCQTCHDPHDASNPHQLRVGTSVLLADGLTVVTNAGAGTICMDCHRSRNGSVSNSIVQYPLKQQTWAGGSSFGPHDNPASDMLEGVNGWTYGQDIPSAAHRYAVTNTCVGCHMQTVASTDPAFLHAGGHTFSMTYDVVTGSVTNTYDKVDVCVQCHGPITSFDMVRQDYNGDGIIEGVQTEVQHLLDKLSTLLPGSTYQSNPSNYVADGLVKNASSQTNWPVRFLKASYNWQFVNNDESKGVHNAPYAVGLLKASIADLTGDANNDSLPDSWQQTYFGTNWFNDPNAGPNASWSHDGYPNWLKYALGLDPRIAGIVVPDGVVWANGSSIGGGTNTVHIYTAAEVAFDTQQNVTYQIQSVSSLSDGWQNVGGPIAGTGNTISFVTPTRSKAQQFYRVVHAP